MAYGASVRLGERHPSRGMGSTLSSMAGSTTMRNVAKGPSSKDRNHPRPLRPRLVQGQR